MSPIAIPTTTPTTPVSIQGGSDGLPPVHPTAARSLPGGLIRVQDERSTKYDDVQGEIRSVYTDRGCEVKSEFAARGKVSDRKYGMEEWFVDRLVLGR